MSASIVHYGSDQCARIPVLQFAGYAIANCGSIPEFEQIVLAQHIDAVLFAEPSNEQLVEAVHQKSTAPLVCFTPDPLFDRHHHLDLIIPQPAKPEEWLLSIRQLVEKSRNLQAQSKALHAEAAGLRADSSAARAEIRKTLEIVRRRRGTS